MSLKGTQVSSGPKQALGLASSPAKPLLPGAPASSSRLMRNSSSLRGRGGDATFPGLACLVGLSPDTQDGMSMGHSERSGMDLGVVGVGAPGMPPAAAREPTAVVLQRRTSNLRPAMVAVSSSQDCSSQIMTEASSHYAAGSQHLDLPSKRRPRGSSTAAKAAVHDSSDTALSQFSAQSAAIANSDSGCSTGDVDSPRAGPQAFQLKWPLQPQPVNSAQTHLSRAAAKIAAGADRYSSAAGTSTSPVADMHPPSPAGLPTEGHHLSLSRRSGQSSAHSSTHSSDLSCSTQTDPFASRPLIAQDLMLSPTSKVQGAACLHSTAWLQQSPSGCCFAYKLHPGTATGIIGPCMADCRLRPKSLQGVACCSDIAEKMVETERFTRTMVEPGHAVWYRRLAPVRGHSGDQPRPDVPCLLVTCKQQAIGLSLLAGIWMPLRSAALAAVMAEAPPPLNPLR